jgi:hypothetical protein
MNSLFLLLFSPTKRCGLPIFHYKRPNSLSIYDSAERTFAL